MKQQQLRRAPDESEVQLQKMVECILQQPGDERRLDPELLNTQMIKNIKPWDSRVALWSKALCLSASCATRDYCSNPGSVAAGRDRETHGAAHNWPSVVRVRGGFGRQGFSCPIGLGVMHADTVTRCTTEK